MPLAVWLGVIYAASLALVLWVQRRGAPALEAEAADWERQAEASGAAIADEGDRSFFLEWFQKQ